MAEYTFRGGRLSAREVWTIEGTVLTGPRGSLDLRHARDAQFAIMAAGRGFQSVEMRFETEGGARGFTCTDFVRGADLRASLALAAEVAAIYTREHPGATFAPTAAARNQPWAVAAITLAALAVALYLLFTSWRRGTATGLDLGLEAGLAILCVVVIVSVAPWKPRTAKTVDELRAWIDRTS
jgi:hypothetical protein